MKKSLLYLVTFLCLGLSFVSCEKEPSKNNLVGKWLVKTTEYGTDSETIQSYEMEGSIIFEFKANGKFIITDLGESDSNSGSWILNGNELRMAYDGDSETMIWTVKKLTASTLVLQMEAEKTMFYYRYVCSKIQ